MVKTSWNKLLDYYLDKYKTGDLSTSEEEQLKFLLHINYLLEYFRITHQYLDEDKIQKEVEFMYPAWTGYENEFWIFCNYEAYGNFLYAYKEAWSGFLKKCFGAKGRSLETKAKDPRIKAIKSKTGSMENLIIAFIENAVIEEVISEREKVVHINGSWRLDISERKKQDWSSLIEKIKNKIDETNKAVFDFHTHMSDLICEVSKI